MRCIWSGVVRFGDEGGVYAKRQIWYRRGDLKNKLWSSPHLLLSSPPGPSEQQGNPASYPSATTFTSLYRIV